MGGSLKNRVVVDFTAVGAEFVALTDDGLIHEWNCYDPYFNKLTAEDLDPFLIVPTCTTRPKIPEPIEWTPEFQKKVKNYFY